MHPVRRKPLWRWELFLFAVVLVLAMAASGVSAARWPVVGPVLAIVLLLAAVAVGAALIVPLFRRGGRDSEGSRRSLDGVELVPYARVAAEAGSAVAPRRLRVDETARRQTSIDAAQATSPTLRAVLTPDASRWLGRELRVAVDLVGEDGAIHRAGFVPRDVDASIHAVVAPLAAEGRAAEVPVSLSGRSRPFAVEIVA
ncbi:hypothetical protein N1031_01785 [Herbiconiux moechotypicola]|uniref:Integral membrane protein n=1 Tax=Herbiconiux moechotypicola TaxID=637393 RepID=A0ABN3D743_9MICO|nr:hypothetical protein [Herbiconiux moechotypicola]MCS5728484.1 hypothetical protein [Herbiconiux moechotypicola]